MELSEGTATANPVQELEAMFGERMSAFERELREHKTGAPADVTALAADFYAFKTFVCKALNLLKSQVDTLTQAADELETRSRGNILLMHGVQEVKDETSAVLCARVRDILSSKLGRSVSATLADERLECHRLAAGSRQQRAGPGGGGAAGPRIVVMRFSTSSARAAVWRDKRQLKETGVTLSEFLTKPRQELYKAARVHFGIKKCWTSEGRILILVSENTIKRVTTAAGLRALMAQHPVPVAPVKPTAPEKVPPAKDPLPGADRSTRSQKKI